MMNAWQKFWGHLRTVMKHRAAVRKLCFKCGLYWQGLTHDLSKYSPVEFWRGVKYYTGKASPHVGERAEFGYSEAWLHHHNRNKHHVEYWWDIVDGRSVPIKMPRKYLTEMICDRVAASMVYLGENYTNDAPAKYYAAHATENMMHPHTREALEGWLDYIREYGIDRVLALMKSDLQQEKTWKKIKKQNYDGSKI